MLKLIMKFSVVLIILNTLIISQVSQQWVERYNGSGNGSDYANDMIIDLAGNIIVTGASFAGSSLNYMTIKYNSAGVQQWTRTYDGLNGEDVAEAVAIDFLGNVYITGRVSVSGAGFNYYTQKMNSSGTVQWGTFYNGPGNGDDKPHTIAVDASGNVYVGGESAGNNTGPDYCLVKYNSSGVQQWVYRYNGTANSEDVIVDMKIDNAGNNIYLTGYANYGSPDYADYTTIRINSTGSVQWVKRYNHSSTDDKATSLTIDGSGNVYVTGWVPGVLAWESYGTVKYNSSGTQLWVAVYEGPGQRIDVASDIELDPSGNVFVTGKSQGVNLLYDFATVKYNSSGVQQWANRWTGSGANQNSYASSLKIDGAGNVYAGGYSGASIFSFDYAVVRYNNAGSQQWWIKYNGTGNANDLGTAIALDGSANVYITGSSIGSSNNADFATLKYAQTVGVQQISSEVPDSYNLYQNYPNPFNPSTTIKFQVPVSGNVKLTIFNALGKEVEKLNDGYLNAGLFSAVFNAQNLNSGVYFYKLESENYVETKKMMLIK